MLGYRSICTFVNGSNKMPTATLTGPEGLQLLRRPLRRSARNPASTINSWRRPGCAPPSSPSWRSSSAENRSRSTPLPMRWSWIARHSGVVSPAAGAGRADPDRNGTIRPARKRAPLDQGRRRSDYKPGSRHGGRRKRASRQGLGASERPSCARCYGRSLPANSRH